MQDKRNKIWDRIRIAGKDSLQHNDFRKQNNTMKNTPPPKKITKQTPPKKFKQRKQTPNKQDKSIKPPNKDVKRKKGILKMEI